VRCTVRWTVLWTMVGDFSQTPESQSKGESSMSATSSFNPVSLMLTAFSVMKEDADYMSNNAHAESSFGESTQKHQPAYRTRSISPNSSPSTPTTADNTVELSPTSSSSLSSAGLASNLPSYRQKPWKGFRSSSSSGGMNKPQPNLGLNGRCLKLAPHIRKQLEVAPLTIDSSSSHSLGDELSISSSFVVASDVLEITGKFVDSLLRTTNVKLTDEGNDEKNHDGDQQPQIPREIVCVHNFAHEQRGCTHLSRLPRDDEFITLPYDDDDDDDLFEVSPRRCRTDTDEYEVVSL
jgi:hypothetical protein